MLADAVVNPVVPTSDLERAKVWYREKLGLVPAMENEGGSVYRCGNHWFALIRSTGAGTNQATSIEFLVAGLADEMAELRRRGVVFEDYDFGDWRTIDGVAEGPEAKSAWFKDSEGNVIALTQLADPGMLASLG